LIHAHLTALLQSQLFRDQASGILLLQRAAKQQEAMRQETNPINN